jgi:hypothetical protein
VGNIAALFVLRKPILSQKGLFKACKLAYAGRMLPPPGLKIEKYVTIIALKFLFQYSLN